MGFWTWRTAVHTKSTARSAKAIADEVTGERARREAQAQAIKSEVAGDWAAREVRWAERDEAKAARKEAEGNVRAAARLRARAAKQREIAEEFRAKAAGERS
jgi:hypothetical protein